MSARSRTYLPLALLGAILALETAHALRRFRSAEERSAEAVVAELRGEVAAQAARLEDDLALGRAHARYLASLGSIRALLGPEGPASFERAGRDAAAVLLHFPSLGRVVLLDAEGRERLRVERVGGGASVVPVSLLRSEPDPDRVRAARAEPGGPAPALEFDDARVDVAERDRQVLRYAAAAGEGALVLSIYAAPLFENLRREEPGSGLTRFLLDAGGNYLAHPDRGKEVRGGRGGSFRADHPQASEAILARRESVAAEGRDRYAAAATGPPGPDGRPEWFLVAEAPERALGRFAESFRAEATGIGLLLLATAAAVFAVGLVLLRLAVAGARLETERAAERRLAEAERLAALGRLTAGVAHEINNPLAGIGNYLALLERDGEKPERRREYLEFLRHGFDRLATIVRDLLAVAHPPTPRREPVHLREVLDRVERIARHDRGFDRVRWERDLPPDLPPAAADPFALEQLFLNLALNARDAMPGGGTIRVRARRDPRDPSRLEIEFEDTGRGIPPEALPRIFEPFFSTRGGTGLGLSLCASIVRAHGGSIRAENRPDGGARFVLGVGATAPAVAEARA
ncbi:MAG TPA: ATP-binding protein [Planctomycetota bacterium]|nr:ATP-binding protein [Planctomycetota bacterium]